MNRNTFCFYFYIKKTKLSKNGEAPIRLRIRVNGISVESQIKRSVPIGLWDQTRSISLGRDKKAREANEYIDMLRLKVLRIHRELELSDKDFSARLIMDRLYGKAQANEMLSEVFENHNKLCTQLIGKTYCRSTVSRYRTCKKHFFEMLKSRFNAEDIKLTNLSYQHIKCFENYLLLEKDCYYNTTIQYLRCLKKITNTSIANKWITKDPFIGIKLRCKTQNKDVLTRDELNILLGTQFNNSRLERVRDIFIFCVFTGMAYIDAYTLKTEHIVHDNNGGLWIKKIREKTENEFHVPLLNIPQQILEKYKDDADCQQTGLLLPIPSNQKMNNYLKEIAALCEIKKHLTTHTARRTYATTVCHENGVAIENISKMLGHTDTRMTLHYTKIADSRIKKDMEQVRETFD